MLQFRGGVLFERRRLPEQATGAGYSLLSVEDLISERSIGTGLTAEQAPAMAAE
jgi:hypothetical protein